MRKKNIPFRSSDNRALRESQKYRTRKRITDIQNMPTASDDIDDSMGKTKNCTTRQVETTRRRNKGDWGKENQEKYMTTWTRPDGNIRRKMDYIAINAKRRNVASTAQINI